MKKFLILSVFALSLGCGQAPSSKQIDWSPRPVESPKVPVMRQVIITDEHGTRTVTVPADGIVPPSPAVAPPMPVLPAAPAKPAPTVGSVRNALNEAIEEMQQALKQAYESDRPGATELYRPLVQRLLAVEERLKKPDCDLAHELQEIREVQAVLKKAVPRTAPVPAVGAIPMPTPDAPAVPAPAVPATPAIPAIPKQA